MQKTFNLIKNQSEILQKLGISALNEMQNEMQQVANNRQDVVLLSPTGTGKTLAFLLPVIGSLKENIDEVQALILVPSRELALQIEQVLRAMGTGFKANAVYGGRTGFQDKLDLKHRPAVLIGTPGRVADHIRRERFTCHKIETLVLDEFDKSLEVGFEAEMTEILDALPNVKQRILTSATKEVRIPDFVKLEEAKHIDYLHQKIDKLEVKSIVAPTERKLQTLVKSLNHFGDVPGIVFCNFKDTIQGVSDYLHDKGIDHGCFYGGMEQRDRENVLVKFRNGTYRLLIATDLAARGIDVPEIKFIIHYQLPIHSSEFTHRNGRTARMNSEGTAYVLHSSNEKLPSFIPELNQEKISSVPSLPKSEWHTLHITAGRRDKVSKGDIVGFLFKQGEIEKQQLGKIEVKQDSSFVAVHATESERLIKALSGGKLKKKKVKISLA